MAQSGGPGGDRARLVLLLADGLGDSAIARELGTTRQRVARWRRRLEAPFDDLATVLADAPRSGRPRTNELDVLALLARAAPSGRETWTASEVAAELGISAVTVHRLRQRWQLTGARPYAPARPAPAVLASSVVVLAAVHLDPPDAAVAYWTLDHPVPLPADGLGATTASAAPLRTAELADLAQVLEAARTPHPDHCFPHQRDLEFRGLLDDLPGTRALARPYEESVSLCVVINDAAMLDSDLVAPWVSVPGVQLSPPAPGITWEEHLEAIVLAQALRADEADPIGVARRLRATVETILRQADDAVTTWLAGIPMVSGLLPEQKSSRVADDR